MHLLHSLGVLWLLPLALTLEEHSPLELGCIPRRSVPFHSESCNVSYEMYAVRFSAFEPVWFKFDRAHWLRWNLWNWSVLFSLAGDNSHMFREEGVFNYTTMLLREDLDLLVVGAREAIYALDLKDISKKLASVRALLWIQRVVLGNHCSAEHF